MKNEKTTISPWGKTVGWGLTVFNFVFGFLTMSESIAGALLLFVSAVLFCPKVWEATNQKVLCVILAVVVYVIGWALIEHYDVVIRDRIKQETKVDNVSNSENDHQTDEVSPAKKKGETEKTKKTADDVETEETEEPSQYYPTDTIQCGNWSVTLWVAWVQHDEIFDEQDVNCYCDITNNGEETQEFFTSNIFQLDNDGVLDTNGRSDYDGKGIAGGTTVKTTLKFSFPDNSDVFLSDLKLKVDDKDVLFTAKPQPEEKLEKLEGTYECNDMQMVLVENSSDAYDLVYFDPSTGVEESTAALDENNRFKVGDLEYSWIPEDSAIYLTNPNGTPDKEGGICFTKSNFEEIETVPKEEVEIGDRYYCSGGLALSLAKKGRKGEVILYTIMEDDEVHIEYKGNFNYEKDMTKLVPINVEGEYSDFGEEKIAFPNGIDGDKIVISEDTLENGLEFIKSRNDSRM